MKVYEKSMPSTFHSVDEAVLEILDLLKTRAYVTDKHALFNIGFMLRELLNNAVEHGNRFSPEKEVHCEIIKKKRELAFVVRDEGGGFKWDAPSEVEVLPDDLLRERNRGFTTLLEMAFKIEVKGNQVVATMALKEEEIV